MNGVYPEDVPGFQQALDAVQVVGGVLLTDVAARQLVMTVAAVLRPHLQAEMFADLADDEIIHALDHALEQVGAMQVSGYFDAISSEIRWGLTRG